MTHERNTKDLPRGTKLKVKVEGIGSFGEGLARIDGAEIFIPKAAPEDELEIEILEKKKGRYRARILELIKASPKRQSAPCKHFEECGGCDFQHLSYEEQIAWKERMTRHWIRRSPLEPFLKNLSLDVIPAENPYAYRHRVRLQVKDRRLHFFKPHSSTLLPIEECPVLVDGFFNQLKESAANMDDQRDWNQSYVQSYEIAQKTLRFDERCFTQANLKMNQKIWKRIEDDIQSLESYESALDLYCGIGNFSLPLKDYFKTVTGVESEGASLEWARKNDPSIDWRAGYCEDVIQTLHQERKVFDFVLLDPPRTGALKVCEALSRLRPARITYVSCSLESLIVDLTFLLKKGGYRVTRWSVVDLFPQTHHIESVVSLVPQ